ncbi:ras-related protein Rab-9A-like isoform X2 [Carassius auratus]|uniref:small monomeric GTPase n=1 Tax=Carassius auratus TaxID=7957 RepID=A0A6P6PMR2_CARAU|nr:ras-related protein Rab-9A-like isoform X2 [Carassius auratus]XP_052455145.1 ras-related protein Rab-9A isoform X2 [Carassius gibelio]
MSFSSCLASPGRHVLVTLHTALDACTLRNGAASKALRCSLRNYQRSVGEVTYQKFLIMTTKSSLLKVILLGDGGVGKSSLMNRYVSNKFDSHLFHTIGVEFLNKELEVDGHTVTLQIWDTAGQERFRSLRTPFYRGSDCCLLTFSVDDNQSFLNLNNWKKEFAFYADVRDPDKFPFVVLGNKVDVTERQVSMEDAQRWCQENGGYPYFETSAKDATNVSGAFEEAVRRVLSSEDRAEHLLPTDTVDLCRKPRANGSCC